MLLSFAPCLAFRKKFSSMIYFYSLCSAQFFPFQKSANQLMNLGKRLNYLDTKQETALCLGEGFSIMGECREQGRALPREARRAPLAPVGAHCIFDSGWWPLVLNSTAQAPSIGSLNSVYHCRDRPCWTVGRE